MNIDDATIYNNEENRDISYSASIFDEPYYLY